MKRSVRKNSLTRANKIYTYQLGFPDADITCVNGTVQTEEYSPSLSDLPQVATFQALYDQYRITKVTIRIIPQMTVSTGPLVFPNLFYYTVLDYNDSATLSSTNQANQHNSCRTTPWMKPFSRTFRPYVVQNTTDSTPTAYVLTKPSPWIATVNPGIAHLGMKFITDNNSGSGDFKWNVRITFVVQFKNVK